MDLFGYKEDELRKEIEILKQRIEFKERMAKIKEERLQDNCKQELDKKVIVMKREKEQEDDCYGCDECINKLTELIAQYPNKFAEMLLGFED